MPVIPGSLSAASPYTLISVRNVDLDSFLTANTLPNEFPPHKAEPSWSPNDDTTPGTPIFDCTCTQIGQVEPIPTTTGCLSTGDGFTLMSSSSPSLFPTQSAWIPFRFKGGCYTIPSFKVTLPGLPTASFQRVGGSTTIEWDDVNYNNYTGAYLQYPSSKRYTELYRDASLSPNEEDFVALRLHLPQDTPNVINNLNFLMQVDYRHRGVDRSLTTTVKVPVVPSAGLFDLINVQPAGPYIPVRDVGQWLSLSFSGLTRLVNFKLTFTPSSQISFTYPKSKDYSSLYWDNQLDVGETDFAAVRIVPLLDNLCPEGKTYCDIPISYSIDWLGALQGSSIPLTETRTLTLRFQGSGKRSAPTKRGYSGNDDDFSLLNTEFANIPVGKPYWLTVSVERPTGYTDRLTDFSVVLEPPSDSGITVNHGSTGEPSTIFLDNGQLGLEKNSFIPFSIYTTKTGSYSLTIKASYTKNGSPNPSVWTGSITVDIVEPQFNILISDVEVNLGSSLAIIPVGGKSVDEGDSLEMISAITPAGEAAVTITQFYLSRQKQKRISFSFSLSKF